MIDFVSRRVILCDLLLSLELGQNPLFLGQDRECKDLEYFPSFDQIDDVKGAIDDLLAFREYSELFVFLTASAAVELVPQAHQMVTEPERDRLRLPDLIDHVVDVVLVYLLVLYSISQLNVIQLLFACLASFKVVFSLALTS